MIVNVVVSPDEEITRASWLILNAFSAMISPDASRVLLCSGVLVTAVLSFVSLIQLNRKIREMDEKELMESICIAKRRASRQERIEQMAHEPQPKVAKLRVIQGGKI